MPAATRDRSAKNDSCPSANASNRFLIIDGLGRAYVGDLGFDLPPPPERGAIGRIILVMPGGRADIVAEGLRFPNGIAVSADHSRLVVAEMDGECLAHYDIDAKGGLRFRGRHACPRDPDGICLDSDGVVASSAKTYSCESIGTAASGSG